MLEQLIQAEKMTTVGTLVSGIGHEINNPLYALHAAAEALADETDIECCRAYGSEILKQATRIAETVKNLSRYAQPGTRHDLQAVDLSEVVEEAVRLAHQSLNDEQIEFEVSDGRVAEISARFEEIMQVVFNLLRNAIQAIPGNGRIQIVTQQHGDFVSLRIQDNGSGIPREHLKRVFDPFFTTKGPDKGEGLGLYIVRQIIIRYGGEIEVDNVDGGGARFEIRFPVANRVDKPEE
jgi:signal transduction histidine kinase